MPNINIRVSFLQFTYNNTQILFIKKTNNPNDCHVCIFNDNHITYIYDELIDDDDSIPINNMSIINN